MTAIVLLCAAAIVACCAWALSAHAGGAVFPPPETPPFTRIIVICHESKVVPSTRFHGIGSTIVCTSQGVVAG